MPLFKLRPLTLLVLLTLLMAMACPILLAADQQVTLLSGAVIVGQVSMDGNAIVVSIDDARLRFPLENIAKIMPGDAEPPGQARKLLLMAIETRLMNKDGKEDLRLLTEAYRLDSEDPQIAFWYSVVLVGAGFGTTADEVFQQSKNAITEAYPGMSQRLASRIKERLALEKLPAALVRRIDAINRAADSASSLKSDRTPMYVMFQLVDQHGAPLRQSEFRMSVSGNDEELRTFDDGYFLFSYLRSQHSNSPCRLQIDGEDLESTSLEITAGNGRVKDAGKLVANRFDESMKQPIRIRVVDQQDKPISGAQVQVTGASTIGRSSTSQQLKTNAEGLAETKRFPGRYSCLVTAEGFTRGTANPVVTRDEGAEVELQLYPAINATARVVWRAQPLQGYPNQPVRPEQPVLPVTTGETLVTLGGGNRSSSEMGNWIRLTQVEDRLLLQVSDSMYGRGIPGRQSDWIRVIHPEERAQANAKALAARFEQLDLEKIADLQQESPVPEPAVLPGNRGAPSTLQVYVSPGELYVGSVTVRDPRNGQPTETAFKLLIQDE